MAAVAAEAVAAESVPPESSQEGEVVDQGVPGIRGRAQVPRVEGLIIWNRGKSSLLNMNLRTV